MLLEDLSDDDDLDLLVSSEESELTEELNLHHAKVIDFIFTIQDYSDSDFKSHFRLRRPTALLLIGMINENFSNIN